MSYTRTTWWQSSLALQSIVFAATYHCRAKELIGDFSSAPPHLPCLTSCALLSSTCLRPGLNLPRVLFLSRCCFASAANFSVRSHRARCIATRTVHTRSVHKRWHTEKTGAFAPLRRQHARLTSPKASAFQRLLSRKLNPLQPLLTPATLKSATRYLCAACSRQNCTLDRTA